MENKPCLVTQVFLIYQDAIDELNESVDFEIAAPIKPWNQQFTYAKSLKRLIIIE